MQYVIRGEFNTGLKVLNEDKLLYYSRCKKVGFDESEIKVFDSSNNLLATVISGKTPVTLTFSEVNNNIVFKGREGISYKASIVINEQLNRVINISYSFFSLFGPYANFYIDNKKIGFVKKDFFKFRSKFVMNLSKEFKDFHKYLLIYLLIFETDYDHI